MQTTPPSLSHFVIFNPTLKPPPLAQDERPLSNVEDDPDDQKAHQQEEDRKDAAQILFYTSRSSRTVSRETMLKQTRLVKGLMGFTDMLVPSNPPSSTSEEPVGLGEKEEPFLSIRTGKSRMIVIQPEKDFYIHLNIVLATAVGEDGQSEPTHNAQGLSDHTIVQAVERGYEDFKLLHGSLASLLPASPTLSSTLERFWTKFAFTLENDIISSPPSLFHAIPSLLTPSTQVQQAVSRALEMFVEDSEIAEGIDYGVVNHTGPLSSSFTNPALHRFLAGLVSATLPKADIVKPDARSTLGIGRKDVRERTTSWGMGGLGTWVPSIPGVTSRSVTPVSGAPAESSKGTPRAGATSSRTPEKSKWNLGIPSLGLGEAMGSVGGVFGLGTTKTAPVSKATGQSPASSRPSSIAGSTRLTERVGGGPIGTPQSSIEDDPRSPDQGNDAEVSSQIGSVRLDDTASIISPTDVDVEDLQDAVEPVVEVDLGWEKRNVYIASNGDHIKRRLSWIIRDNILLYILYPSSAEAPFLTPHSKPTLALYSKLNSILSPERESFDSSRSSHLAHSNEKAISTVVVHADAIENSGEIDPASSASLVETREMIESDLMINEVYAKTPAAKFIVSKRLKDETTRSSAKIGKEEQVHLVIGRKDANLTDAEHALRSFLRARQV